MKKAISFVLIASILLTNLITGVALPSMEYRLQPNSYEDEVRNRSVPFPDWNVLAKFLDWAGRFLTLRAIARELQEAITNHNGVDGSGTWYGGLYSGEPACDIINGHVLWH